MAEIFIHCLSISCIYGKIMYFSLFLTKSVNRIAFLYDAVDYARNLMWNDVFTLKISPDVTLNLVVRI